MNAIIFSAVWGIVMMFSGIITKNKITIRNLAIAGIILLFVVNAIELKTGAAFFSFRGMNLMHTDSFSLSFLAVMFGCTLLYFLLSGSDILKVGEHGGEYFALLFFVLCGVALSATFNTLLLLFLGIEIMTIPQYILTGANKQNLKGNEAALKYFLMGAFSTGILLMGIAFIYGGNSAGSFFIDAINLGQGKLPVMLAVGLVFLVVALGFKVSAAPFHFWTPDVYDGAPTVFTSFISTIAKAAGFFAFIRLFQHVFGSVQDQWQVLIAILIVATLLFGNITAIFQQSVKRMLAYSSIAQAGFLMFSVFALNDWGREGLVLYSAAYSLATIGLFGILLKMNDYTLDGFNGLAKHQPLIALTATIFLLSLTGIPLTAGFLGKFYMLVAAVQTGHHSWLVIVAVLFAAISAYYYFRVIQAMYFKPMQQVSISPADAGRGFKLMLVVLAVLIIVLGIYPELLLGWLYH